LLVGASIDGDGNLAGGTSRPAVDAIRAYIDKIAASDGRTPNISVVIVNPPK